MAGPGAVLLPSSFSLRYNTDQLLRHDNDLLDLQANQMLNDLLFRQRLGGKQVHGARRRVGHQQIQHRQVVAQRLPAGRRRNDGYVLARLHRSGTRGTSRGRPSRR